MLHESVSTPQGEEYYLFYAGGDGHGHRLICLATCPVSDITTWKRLGPVLDLGAEGDFDALWCVLPCVHRIGGKWHLYYTGRNAEIGKGLQSFTGIGLTISDDLLHWKRASETPVLCGDGFEDYPGNQGIAGGGRIVELPQDDGRILYRMNFTLSTGTPSDDLLVDQAKTGVTADSYDGFTRFNKQVALRPRLEADSEAEMVAEWTDRGVRKRRYLIDVSMHLSASVQVNLPADLQPGERRPAIQCWHGHGPYGKDPVMGNVGPQGINENIERMNYDYGHQMATHGFITYAVDWMGHGEQNERLKPHFRSVAGERDWCNLYYLHATMFGMTSLSINLAHGRAATDFVATLPEVAPKQLGVMGLSGGGTMCLWTALTDSRFNAAEIICYSDRWARFGIRDINYCGMQVAPGLFQWVDLPDLQGLLAPLPLLIDIGATDECFHVDNATNCYQELKAIYRAAGASDNLYLDLFPGQHSWGGNRSVDFFNKYLCS